MARRNTAVRRTLVVAAGLVLLVGGLVSVSRRIVERVPEDGLRLIDRAGSVVARIEIVPTPRPYTDHRAYCLFYSQGACGKCIKRCPVGALSENGHDKVRCLQHLKPVTADYVKANYHFDGYGCGLCQVGVPCEAGIPNGDDM